jgi:hypothetical protein
MDFPKSGIENKALTKNTLLILSRNASSFAVAGNWRMVFSCFSAEVKVFERLQSVPSLAFFCSPCRKVAFVPRRSSLSRLSTYSYPQIC